MKPSRSGARLVALYLIAALLVSTPPLAASADYPSRPVRWIVGYPAGGTTDIVARLIGHWLSERLGQQFIIENKPGAGNNIGTEAMINSPPDGYTVLLTNPANAINATLYQRLFQLHAGHGSRRRLHAGTERDGGQPEGSGEQRG
jgi:tripartite-type tricarboxylate transporter receptor subunit TctC